MGYFTGLTQLDFDELQIPYTGVAQNILNT
jgi:hypothetical protein